jgi:GT2 family glycosyltransferase
VEAGRNCGFAAGVNLGIKVLDGKHVLILNPDTYFERNIRKEVVAAFERDAGIGVVGLDLINPDGSRQYSARRFYTLVDIAARRSAMVGKIFSGRIERHLMKDNWHIERPFDADWVLGTGFVIRRTVYQEIGGMDERYFLYFEDVDLCARVWQTGYRVVALPNVCLVHDHQRSSAVRPLSFAGRAHLASLWRFTRKFDLPFLRQPSITSIGNRGFVERRNISVN